MAFFSNLDMVKKVQDICYYGKKKTDMTSLKFLRKKLQEIMISGFQIQILANGKIHYHKVASSNMSCLEAHAGFFRLLMKGIFDPYIL